MSRPRVYHTSLKHFSPGTKPTNGYTVCVHRAELQGGHGFEEPGHLTVADPCGSIAPTSLPSSSGNAEHTGNHCPLESNPITSHCRSSGLSTDPEVPVSSSTS